MEQYTLLSVNHIDARYENTHILRNVSLQVNQGEIVCLIGESGCGKTTLLSTILQMPNGALVEKGQINFEEKNLLNASWDEMRKIRGARIGMVYQEPGASLDPVRKIGVQFYETLREHKKITRTQALNEARELFIRFGLTEVERILNSYPIQLSGGMNQRVAIALAMILRPSILLADEPTSALDVTVQKQIVGELLKLRDTFGTAILLSTHNIGVVRHIADKVAVMYGGRIVEYGNLENVLSAPAHPYTRALIASIPKLGSGLPKGIPGQRKAEHFSLKGCAYTPRCHFAKEGCDKREQSPIAIGEQHWALCREMAYVV